MISIFQKAQSGEIKVIPMDQDMISKVITIMGVEEMDPYDLAKFPTAEIRGAVNGDCDFAQCIRSSDDEVVYYPVPKGQISATEIPQSSTATRRQPA